MIISHRHKFIFLKTNKTAGTSIEIALSKFCGPEDVITPISGEDEELRRSLGYRGPQNFRKKLWQLRLSDWPAIKRKRRLPPQFYNHIPAADIKARVPASVWSSYFKFCVERNPWDRAVSVYYWRYKTEPRPSIAEFIAGGEYEVLKKKGSGLYSIDGKPVADYIVRFEDMAAGLEEVRQRIGLPESLVLPRAKGGYRVDKRPYQELLSTAERDRVARDFAWEIETFGYRF